MTAELGILDLLDGQPDKIIGIKGNDVIDTLRKLGLHVFEGLCIPAETSRPFAPGC